MGEFSGIKAIWYRELLVFRREWMEILSAIITPLVWIVLFGTGLGSRVEIDGLNYRTFVYPGIIVQSILFTSIFYGTYLIWDRKVDLLKEVMVAPITRFSMFLGKVLGGANRPLVQVMVLLAIAGFFGIHVGIANALLVLVFAVLLVVSMTSIGLIIGSRMENAEAFSLIFSLVMYPMFFISWALFPVDNLPGWLALLNKIDPATYAVDAFRELLLGTRHFGLVTDFIVLTAFAALFLAIGAKSFEGMKA